MAVHCSAHHDVVSNHLVEKHVLVERTEHHEKSPVTKSRVNESAARPKLAMLTKKPTGGLNCVQVAIGNFLVCVL